MSYLVVVVGLTVLCCQPYSKGTSLASMVPFSEINFALLRETGIIGALSILGRGSLEMRTEKLCVYTVPDTPYRSVCNTSLRKMMLVTFMRKK